MKGRQPYSPDMILQRGIRPAIKVMQELLRHASSRITLDIYTQANESGKARSPGTSSGEVFTRKWESMRETKNAYWTPKGPHNSWPIS
jgi:hypothetical protein